MKHDDDDDDDNTMKLSYNKQLRATAVIAMELFRITSHWSTHRTTQYRKKWK